MKKKKKSSKALVMAAIVAGGVYIGSHINTNNNSNYINVPIEQTIDGNYQNINSGESISLLGFNAQAINGNNLYTLFKDTQIYSSYSNGNIIIPSKINDKNVCVTGIEKRGEFTLIQFSDGSTGYVEAKNLVQIVNIGNNFNSSPNNPDMTINTDSYIYNHSGACVGYLEKGTRCIEISYNDTYSFIITENEEYYFINRKNLTLTSEYSKGFNKPKKLNIDSNKLNKWPYRNIYDNLTGAYTDHVDFPNLFSDEYISCDENNYATLYKERPIYFRNGDLVYKIFSQGVTVRLLKENSSCAYVQLPDGTTGYVDKENLGNCLRLDINTFDNNLNVREVLTTDWEYLYDITGAYQGSIYPSTSCIAVSTNGEYTLVILEDGRKVFVHTSNLIPSDNKIGKYVYMKDNSSYYFKKENGEYELFENNYLKKGHITYMFYTDGEYVFIGDEYCRDNYYAKISDIDLTYNITDVNLFGYVKNDTKMSETINGEANIDVDDFQLLVVKYNCGEYSYVYDISTKKYGYIKTSELNYLYNNFVFIDLDEQRMYLYELQNGLRYISNSWPIRSGKDSTPSHEGDFDIDWKAENWEFTTYPGSVAEHWIAYNEFGEGIHDLVNDDEENYGNQGYHNYGSHGCVRTTKDGSRTIYEKCPVGTMALVNRK